MLLSNGAMSSAAGEIRELATLMTRAVHELDVPQSWSGRDADAFQRDWNELVHSRLMIAADKLDGVSFQDVTEGFGG